MDPHVAKLTTPEECDQFILNVAEDHPDLALQATRRSVELLAERKGAKTETERDALRAVYAYEAVRTKIDGKKFRASRTWPMIDRHGIIGAVERLVKRKEDTAGYRALAKMNLMDYSFEAVVLRHPDQFSEEASKHCGARLAKYEAEHADTL